MKRVLIVGISSDKGGIEILFYNLIQKMNSNKIHFDILAFCEKCAFEEEFIDFGVTVYHLPERGKNPIKYYKELKSFFKSTRVINYDYVWVNQSSACNISVEVITKKYTSAKVISHSHSTNYADNNFLRYYINLFLHYIHRRKLVKLSDSHFACSLAASDWLFGGQNRDEVKLIRNGIDTDKFKYNELNRQEIRKQYNITNEIIVGHVGRFATPKNQFFLIDVFEQFILLNPNSKLLLIGDGEDRKQIIDLINQKKLNNQVIFTGCIDDVNRYYNAMDVFLLPSLYEGFPITLVETQCNGLVSIVSDTITKETKLTDLFIQYPLNKGAQYWATKMNAVLEKKNERDLYYQDLRKEKYDLVSTVLDIETFLLSDKINV